MRKCSIESMFSTFDGEHVFDITEPDGEVAYEVDETGTVTVPIHGVIMKEVPDIFRMFGIEATSTLDTEALIRAADEDPEVERIILDIDSPGGTLSGTPELANTVLATQKPVVAVAGELVASAAYWVASHADSIVAESPTSEVGSIGVYRTMVDSSEAAKAQGLKVTLISSGPHKGAGEPGTEVTDEMIRVEQELIDQAADMFVTAIAGARGLDKDLVEPLATGRTWFAKQAEARGLIDHVIGDSEVSASTGAGEIMSEHDAPQPEAAEDTESERLSAEVEAQRVALEEIYAGRKAEFISRAQDEGRVTPAMLDAVERFAVYSSAEEVSDFLDALPIQTRVEAEGSGDTNSPELESYTEEEIKIAEKFGVKPSDLKQFAVGVPNTVKG